MSVYSVKGKGYRYDFWMKCVRYADQWFKTKREGQAAEAKRREEILNPKPVEEIKTPTDTTFEELVNERLDNVQAYNSKRHYDEFVYLSVDGWENGEILDIQR